VARKLTSVATRAYDLCKQKLLPGYMIKRYSQTKNVRASVTEHSVPS